MPIQNITQTISFSKRCGASVPEWLIKRFEGSENDEKACLHIAADIAAQQCETLLAAGVETLHFYSLNKAEPTASVCDRIGVGR